LIVLLLDGMAGRRVVAREGNPEEQIPKFRSRHGWKGTAASLETDPVPKRFAEGNRASFLTFQLESESISDLQRRLFRVVGLEAVAEAGVPELTKSLDVVLVFREITERFVKCPEVFGRAAVGKNAPYKLSRSARSTANA
jgi:hypothetical protein